jgi:hypothetical protein
MSEVEDFINIQTPFGDIKIEKVPLQNFVKGCIDDSKKEDSLKHSDIYSFLGSKEINQEFKSL